MIKMHYIKITLLNLFILKYKRTQNIQIWFINIIDLVFQEFEKKSRIRRNTIIALK